MKNNTYLRSHLAHFLFRTRFFWTKFVEKFKTHILWSFFFFFLENLSVYEMIWKHTVYPKGPELKI